MADSILAATGTRTKQSAGMSTLMHQRQLGQSRPSYASKLDGYAMVPVAACAYAVIVSPLLFYFNPPQTTMDTDYAARVFWPAMAAISVILALRSRSRLRRLTWPPHILCLFICLAWAGTSVLWAFDQQSSFLRFAQQVMI